MGPYVLTYKNKKLKKDNIFKLLILTRSSKTVFFFSKYLLLEGIHNKDVTIDRTFVVAFDYFFILASTTIFKELFFFSKEYPEVHLKKKKKERNKLY